MVQLYPHLSASTDDEHQENENGRSTERTGLLASIADFRLPMPSLPPETFLGADNIASYGSIANRNSNSNNSDSDSDSDTHGTIRTVDNGYDATIDHTSIEEELPRNSLQQGTDFVDVEEGENQQWHREGNNDPTSMIETVNSNDNDNDDDNQNDNPNSREQQQQSSPTERTTPSTTPVSEEEEAFEPQAPRDGPIGNITRRLRCLFSAITFPIVPMGTIVSMALLWVFYAASTLDLQKSCSHPLHSYALMSLLMVAYIPSHSQVRSQIFHYSRERDGPVRPTRVRMYDQFFHTVCLLYVYTGAMLIQTCREDLVDQNSINVLAHLLKIQSEGIADPINTCEATCPNLYAALSVYVATLELFTFALILPLLFLPCIYLWFLQRATAEADAFARLQDRLQEEDALLSNGGVTTGAILDSLETVKIVSRQQAKPKIDGSKNTEIVDETDDDNNKIDDPVVENDSEQQQCWILPYNASPNKVIGTKCETKECCICMTQFDIEEEESSSSSSSSSDDGSGSEEKDPLVTNSKNDDKDYKCPATTKDFSEDSSLTIVRTRCGHLFHKECLKGWVGGMWSVNTNSNNYQIENQQDWRKRKARQIHCPLCREDLRPNTLTSSTNSNND